MALLRAHAWFYPYTRFTCEKSYFWAKLPWKLSKNTVFFHCTKLYNFLTTPPYAFGMEFFFNFAFVSNKGGFKNLQKQRNKNGLDKGGFWLSNFHMPTMLHYILHQKPKKVRFSPSSLTQMYLVICKVSWQQKIVSDVNFGSTLRNSKLICEDQKNIEAMHSRKSKQFFIKLENIEHIGFHVLNW